MTAEELRVITRDALEGRLGPVLVGGKLVYLVPLELPPEVLKLWRDHAMRGEKSSGGEKTLTTPTNEST